MDLYLILHVRIRRHTSCKHAQESRGLEIHELEGLEIHELRGLEIHELRVLEIHELRDQGYMRQETRDTGVKGPGIHKSRDQRYKSQGTRDT